MGIYMLDSYLPYICFSNPVKIPFHFYPFKFGTF